MNNVINPNVDVNPLADETKTLEAQIANINVADLDPLDNGKVKQTSSAVEQAQAPVQTETKVHKDPSLVNITSESTVDPILAELDRIKGQTQGKTPKEKFEYKIQRDIAQAKAMGIDVASIAGIKQADPEEEDEDKPLTRKDIEALLKQNQPKSKTALEMAMEINNEAEKELHMLYLDEVNPNLSEEQKFKAVSERVEGIKLKNQLNLSNLRPNTQSHSTASSFQPAKPNQQLDNAQLTRDEQLFFDHARVSGTPLTKEEIIKMRK